MGSRRSGVAAIVAAAAVVLAGCAAETRVVDTPSATCADGTPASTSVVDSASLEAALAASAPGDVIVLADARYEGGFRITTQGTPDEPITLCGGAGAVLDGGGVDSGYVLHLEGAEHWLLSGFSVTGGQKGIMLDASSHNALSGLTVSGTGDEAVHLRAASSDNLVESTSIDGAGLRRAEFGEGIYVGSAESNWCEISGCSPDASDRNRLVGNTVTGTSAEAIDVKEGTTGGEISGNTLGGSSLTAADSLLDIKGSDWLIEGNRGTASPADGAQVHVILPGWGARNTFRSNSFEVAATGWAILVEGAARSEANTVACSNEALVDRAAAPEAVSNVPCSG